MAIASDSATRQADGGGGDAACSAGLSGSAGAGFPAAGFPEATADASAGRGVGSGTNAGRGFGNGTDAGSALSAGGVGRRGFGL